MAVSGGSRGELLVPAEGRPGARSLLERIAAGRVTTWPCRARHRDGHLVELAVWTTPVPEPPGGDGGVLAFLVDVSAVLEVRVSRAVLDGLFGQSPIGLSAFDGELRHLRVNTALESRWASRAAERGWQPERSRSRCRHSGLRSLLAGSRAAVPECR
ncbi:hypothetical protein ACFY0A_21720 [Streptomyces sp. NPDC001698]|uniref:hypothetical protein n=1 Tax=Streptomyces sp. NPDC001698 TaxID=3364601 RepID=UPI0036C94A29